MHVDFPLQFFLRFAHRQDIKYSPLARSHWMLAFSSYIRSQNEATLEQKSLQADRCGRLAYASNPEVPCRI